MDFSLVLGGPLYQLMRRAHVTNETFGLLRTRLVAIVAIAWVPLLVLSLLEGQALGGPAAVPFLKDAEAQVRFLVALPLLVFAELVVHQRMRLVVRQFLDRKLIPDVALPRFDAAIASAFRLRNSLVAELILVAVVYVFGVMGVWRHYIALSGTATWYAAPAGDRMALSTTGLWYAFVSLPLFQFLLIRWYFRILIWTRFLWQVSRIELSLIPTHPDRLGGLGFLSNIAYAFTPLALAHGALVAGPVANRIFYLGASLLDFKAEVAFIVLFVMALVFAPFLVFVAPLASAKRTGLRDYGNLAERYVREFDRKWLRGGAPPEEPLIGSGDIQSLADLGNSFEIVKTMRLAPMTRDAVLRLFAATVAPIVPLFLTMMSLEDLVRKLLGLVF